MEIIVASNARRLSRGQYPYGCDFRTARQRQRCGARGLHSDFEIPSNYLGDGDADCS